MAYLIRSDESLVINGKTYPGLPMILQKDFSVTWPLTEFLRVRRAKAGDGELTVERKARALRDFAEYLESQPKSLGWDQVDDDILQAWGNSMLGKTKAENIQFKVSTVVHMYFWAQRNGYFHRMVGVTDIGRKVVFPITVTADRYDPKTGIASGKVTTTLVFKDGAKAASRYPSNSEVDAVKDGLIVKSDKLKNSGLAEELLERNMLIVETALQAGLRRAEIASSLKVSDLPPEEYVRDCIERGVTMPITVTGKGPKVRLPQFHPELVLMLIDHCTYAREEILSRFRGREGYSEPDQIFVSAKTGQALTPQSITDLISDAASSQGVRVSPQDLRRKALTRMVALQMQLAKAETDGVVDDTTVLLRAQQQMGHNDLQTTFKCYLRLSKEKEELPNAQPYMESEAVRILKTKLGMLERRNPVFSKSEKK